MIDGIINVYKEASFTSFDVIAKMRGICHQKKIGHTGTLDPDATGVLPVCLGNATKVCELLTDRDKTYETVFRLGVETDTQDMSGALLDTKPVTIDADKVYQAIMGFVGTYDQVPPMYSAKKINGRKLYELAREGKVVERKPCRVQIKSIQVHEINLPEVKMTVICSKGTYIRTLCHDIGEKLGCHAAMVSLMRTRVGNFMIEKSLTLGEIEALAKEEKLSSICIPVDEVFSNLPRVMVSEDTDRFLHNGNCFSLADSVDNETKIWENEVRVYDSKGIFTGIFKYDITSEKYHPVKMFLSNSRE